jgi:hypothetical protein
MCTPLSQRYLWGYRVIERDWGAEEEDHPAVDGRALGPGYTGSRFWASATEASMYTVCYTLVAQAFRHAADPLGVDSTADPFRVVKLTRPVSW